MVIQVDQLERGRGHGCVGGVDCVERALEVSSHRAIHLGQNPIRPGGGAGSAAQWVAGQGVGGGWVR
jgi:hypothetical protein